MQLYIGDLECMYSESFVYFECPVKSSHRGTVEVFEWHPLHPIIAVSLSKGRDNGENTSESEGVVTIYDQAVSLTKFFCGGCFCGLTELGKF